MRWVVWALIIINLGVVGTIFCADQRAKPKCQTSEEMICLPYQSHCVRRTHTVCDKIILKDESKDETKDETPSVFWYVF